VSERPAVAVATGVWRAFGETRALRDVSLDVVPGECHGLVGRNGAGKSTLVAILTGLTRPDRGEVRLLGEPAPSPADRAAWQRRVACVYQRSMVVPTLTVAENVFLNRPPGRPGWLVSWPRLRRQAHDVMLDWGFDLDVDRLAGELSVEQRQVVEIARALSSGARFLILDEPTAALERDAIDRLFQRVRRLQESGVGILFISHHLEEVFEVCDRVTVLRDGRRVLTRAVAGLDQGELVAAMVGAASTAGAADVAGDEGPAPGASPALAVRRLFARSGAGPVEDVSLEVRPGECLGLLGLRGSGAVTVADAAVGLVRPERGVVLAAGRPLPPGRVAAALARGVGYVPEDRHARGLVPTLGVAENLTMAMLGRLSRWGLVSRARRDGAAAEMVRHLDIVASGPDQPAGQLSGGNQQKVVVGRALAPGPSVLVVVTPTVGVDVASKEALLGSIARARAAGMAVLLVSDDMDDLRICTRLLVMVRGRLVREVTERPWNRAELIAAMEGLAPEPAGRRDG
jgi:simple sugar transport system ATP-binding protein